MAEKKEFKLPTSLQYQRILMAHRVLTVRGLEPTQRIYNLIKGIHAAKDELGLEFSDTFNARVASEKNIELNQGKLDSSIVEELRPKIDIVHRALIKRFTEVNAAVLPKAEADKLPSDAERSKALEKAIETKLEKSDLERNIQLLSEALQFNKIQTQILLFYACAPKGRFDAILDAAHLDNVISHEDYIDSLAILMDLRAKKDDLEAELEPDSILVGVKFLAHDEKNNDYSVDKPLQRILSNNYKSVEQLLFSLLGPSPSSELSDADYAYMANDLETMTSTLEGFLRNGEANIRQNMTIGGPPGTGKTEITAILATRLKARAFLVGVAEKSKTTGFTLEEPTRNDRINALVRCAFIVRQTKMRAILVFDEAEDILRDLNSEQTKEAGSKAFINELLENLHAPVVFISNRTDLFDPATIRRILPYYGMNYMPFAARVGTIVTKAKQYIQAELTQDDVKRLSRLANRLSVAIIDSCIVTAALRLPAESPKEKILGEIECEFNRALKAQNGGIPPLPIPKDFEVEKFDPELIAASGRTLTVLASLAQKPKNLAGTDITLIGPSGTGRKSIAQYLATQFGMEPRIIPISNGWLEQDPSNAHALDLERAALDNTPLVFIDALKFLASSNGHPFMSRVRAHSLPTFFVSDYPDEAPQAKVEELLSHLTFVVRTGVLSPKQMQTACKRLLGFEIGDAELKTIKETGIGPIMTVRRQLETLGQEKDKAAALEMLEAISARLDNKDKRVPGFGAMLQNGSDTVSPFTRRVGR